MLRQSRTTAIRIGLLAFVGALALTAAYYYGATKAQSVVALPAAISLSGQAAAATSESAAPVSPVVTTPAASATSAPTTTATTATAAAAPSTSPPSSATRQVVTPVRGWDCDTDRGSGPAGQGGTTYRDCW